MIDYSTHAKLREAGVHCDMLGQRLSVGDTVLVKGYSSPQINTQATILSVNRKSISVNLESSYVTWGRYHPMPEGHTGYWNHYPDRKIQIDIKRMTRNPYEVLKVPQSLIDSARAEFDTLVDEHPEVFI